MRRLFLLVFILILAAPSAWACDSCACALARAGNEGIFQQKLFFDFTVEQINWDKKDLLEAHELHEEGHDFHNKTTEELYHFSLGFSPVEALTIVAQLPYVVRTSLEIEDHDRLGEKEVSEGLGDLKLTAIYRFLRNGKDFLGAVGGLKFPTGETKEVNSQGARFEPELQPGSGSYDPIVGAAFQKTWGRLSLYGNALYTIRGEGAQEFEFGDAFSSYVILDALVNPENKSLLVKPGIDLNFQSEDRQTHHGQTVADSGGTTLFLGPALTLKAGESVSIMGNILFPVYQNLGGVHQEVDFVWNASAKLAW